MALPQTRRQVVALAGPPASGKSTLAAHLADALTEAGRAAVVVPMDGFHLDNHVLDAKGLRARKGAPDTFDLRGFAGLLRQLTEGGEVFFPLFDRDRDLSVTGAGHVPAACDLVIVEGNYLLFDAPGWRDLRSFWDLSVYLDVPEPELLLRLQNRWLSHGLGPVDARFRVQSNDLPNATLVGSRQLKADVILAS